MMVKSSCNSSTLRVFVPSSSNPWNLEKIEHLYRRADFGGQITRLKSHLQETPEQTIDAMVDSAVQKPATKAPYWGHWDYNDYINEGLDPNQANNEFVRAWSNQMVKDLLIDGLRGRMTLFWHNHFVTQLSIYRAASYQYQYYSCLQTHCLGNFKDFVRAIGLTNAMLVFLNGFENTANRPNENYARELYELFTLGADNGYTEQDIVETSKALTGFNRRSTFGAAINFHQPTFNNSEKTIFGRTGNWEYDDVIDILFEEKSELIARFIAEKIYRYLVNPVIDEAIVNDLAASFQQDFDIAKLVKRILKSEHFFDSSTFGTQIKSPYDLINNYMLITGFTFEENIYNGIYNFNSVMGQALFNPVDVAGWQGDKVWINSSTLSGRWEGLQYLVYHTYNNHPEEFRAFAIEAANASNDPMEVTRGILHQFLPKGFHEERYYEEALEVFKADIPQNYFDGGYWNLVWEQVPLQVALLLLYIVRLPELQMK